MSGESEIQGLMSPEDTRTEEGSPGFSFARWSRRLGEKYETEISQERERLLGVEGDGA